MNDRISEIQARMFDDREARLNDDRVRMRPGWDDVAYLLTQLAEASQRIQHLGTESEMANAQLRGWRDFFSGQPKDMPFTEPGSYAKNSQLNFAWTLGYESAQDSELFKLMVGRADRAMNHSQELANQLAEASQRIEALQAELKELKDQGLPGTTGQGHPLEPAPRRENEV